MKTLYNPNQSPRVIIIQKLYGNFFNEEKDLRFTKHRFKKFIKDVVTGTIERDDVIKEELNKYLNEDYDCYLLQFLFTSDFGIFEEFQFLQCSHFSEIWFFEFSGSFLRHVKFS